MVNWICLYRGGGGRQRGSSNLPVKLTWSCRSGAQTSGTLPTSDTPLLSLHFHFSRLFFICRCFDHKGSISSSFHTPAAQSVGQTRAGEAATWLGRTETPAAGRRGRNTSTTSRRSSTSKNSSERE